MLMSEKDRQDMHVARRSAIGSLSILRLTKRQCACSPFSHRIKYATAEQELFDLFRDQLPSVRRDVVVVDTALPLGVAEEEQGRLVMGGDNSAREFSAFDSGVARVGEGLRPRTSRLRRSDSYWDYLERFQPATLEAIAGRPACLGHIDCYNEPIQVAGCTSQHWVRTSCIFLPPLELKILGSLVSIRDPTPWFSGDPSIRFARTPHSRRRYRRLIIDWLTGQDIGQGVKWHSGMALDPTTLRVRAEGAGHPERTSLWTWLRAAGCGTIDVTWLSGQLARGSVNVDWSTPWWQQLAERDRHQLRVRTALRPVS